MYDRNSSFKSHKLFFENALWSDKTSAERFAEAEFSLWFREHLRLTICGKQVTARHEPH